MGRIRLENAEAMIALGRKMAQELSAHAVLALWGDLGAGKTTFVQGLALGLGIREPIQSPTFVLLNDYEDKLYHFDLYRLKSETDFKNLGFEEYLYKKGLSAVEWPGKIASLLPAGAIHLHFYYSEKGREVEIVS